MRRPQNLQFRMNDRHDQHDEKLKEIMKNSGKLKIRNIRYDTSLQDMEHIEELGNGTCGHVVKMRHQPSQEIIAVKVSFYKNFTKKLQFYIKTFNFLSFTL